MQKVILYSSMVYYTYSIFIMEHGIMGEVVLDIGYRVGLRVQYFPMISLSSLGTIDNRNSQCTMHNVMHNAQCTMHNAQCTMHAQGTMLDAQCTMHNAACPNLAAG
jgi:hypothetical protein